LHGIRLKAKSLKAQFQKEGSFEAFFDCLILWAANTALLSSRGKKLFKYLLFLNPLYYFYQQQARCSRLRISRMRSSDYTKRKILQRTAMRHLTMNANDI
jgi:hypothetical protein